MSPTRPMVYEKDVLVPMRVGDHLRANVFRPQVEGRYPAIVTLGPYGKDVHVSQFMPAAWEHINAKHPEILQASSCKYLVFETPDPEAWVPHGYAIIKIDSRGSGKSPGFLDVNSPAESRDLFDAIEWAAAQPWCNGKVGLLGISYYAAGQWSVAALKPPHLHAMIPWQGTHDFYRDRTRQDGIFSAGFLNSWWPRSVLRNQYGNAESPLLDIDTGLRTTGPASLTREQLIANRTDYMGDVLAHPLLDDWYRARCPDLSRIEIPALVVANWGGLALHLRGTIGGYLDIASREKWLKIQSGSYFATFWHPDNVAVQRKFFDRYLKDMNNGWESEPRVTVEVRSADDGVADLITDRQWPLGATQWRKLHLDAGAQTLTESAPVQGAALTYEALSQGVTFNMEPLSSDLCIAGPIKLRAWVASDTSDMDLFATLQAFDPEGREITFLSAIEPRCPVSQGWLRVSHRKLDPVKSTEFRPFHTHDERQPLRPGEVYGVDLEIWPTSLALEKGSRLALILQGKDFERPGTPGPFRGSGFFTHESEADRPPAVFGGKHTIHTGPERECFLLIPEVRA